MRIFYILFLLSFLLLHCSNSYKEKGILFPVLISFVLFIATFGKLFNMYYLMAFLPLCLVSMMIFNFVEKKGIKVGLLIVLFVCLVFYGCNPALHFVEDLILQREKELVIYDNFHHCIENIPESERDSIYNYNLKSLGTSMLQHENLIQCNRVLFSTLIFDLPTLWNEETSKPFVPPKWFLFTPDRTYDKYDIMFMLKNYDLVYSFHYDKLYFEKPHIGEDAYVYLYRRRD